MICNYRILSDIGFGHLSKNHSYIRNVKKIRSGLWNWNFSDWHGDSICDDSIAYDYVLTRVRTGRLIIRSTRTINQPLRGRDDRGIVTVHRWSSGSVYRRRAVSDRWGWRSWRHEVRAPHGRLVSIVPRLPRDERARSKFLRPRLFAVDSLPFPSSPFSLFSFSLPLSFIPFSFCRSFTKSRPRRTRACEASLALLRYRSPEPAACVRLWRFRGSAAYPG